MSLVPTYVQAVDGQFYKNPILSGNDWFLCFDDDDPPELVVEVKHQSKLQVRARAVKILEELKIQCGALRLNSTCGRCFSPEGTPIKIDDFREASGFLINDFRTRIPVPQEHQGIIPSKEKIRGDCVYYELEEPK